jgi:hypothetical protein
LPETAAEKIILVRNKGVVEKTEKSFTGDAGKALNCIAGKYNMPRK